MKFFFHFRSSTSESETAGGQSEESCATTFSTSPGDAPKVVGHAPHHQSQPIRINIQGSSPVCDRFPDFRTQRYCVFAENCVKQVVSEESFVKKSSV